MAYRIMLLLIIGALLINLTLAVAHADSNKTYISETNYEIYTSSNTVINEATSIGCSMAQIDLSANTDGLQWGIGACDFDGSGSLAGSLGYRLNKHTFMKGSIGIEGDKKALGFGITGRF